MKKKNRPNSVLMGMLICIVIAFAVTLGGFAILRRQMAKTGLEETKEQSYEAHYAFIVDNPEDEYWQQVYEAAKEEGKKQNIYVEQISDNVSQTYETKEYMDIAIAEKVDGILLQSSSKAVGSEMNAAMEAGIPVVTMLHDNYSGRRCAFVGVNDSSLGDSYAELIQENISKKKNDVLVLMEKNGDLGESNLVLQTIRQKVQGAKIRVQLLKSEDEFATEKAVRDCILDEKQCPDVLVSLSLSGTAYAYQAVVDYSKVGTVKIIGAYENDEIRRGLEKNVIAASVSIDPEAIGQTAIQTLQEYKKNGIVNEYQMIQQKVIRGGK
ncbi:aBC-type sugar transport system periplasmic component-like protein [Roseburia sp. CAG:309]|nr:aBC-type sugar transport system periplasmic component-like protein [Roseburia sp. CAG:309]